MLKNIGSVKAVFKKNNVLVTILVIIVIILVVYGIYRYYSNNERFIDIANLASDEEGNLIFKGRKSDDKIPFNANSRTNYSSDKVTIPIEDDTKALVEYGKELLDLDVMETTMTDPSLWANKLRKGTKEGFANICPKKVKALAPPPAIVPVNVPTCIAQSDLIGNISQNMNSGVEVFYYSWNNDNNFFGRRNQIATYYGREIRETIPEMYNNDMSTFSNFNNKLPLVVMIRTLLNNKNTGNSNFEIVSPEGVALKIDNALLVNQWTSKTVGVYSSPSFQTKPNMYMQLYFYLSQVATSGFRLRLKNNNIPRPINFTELSTQVNKNMPVARWDFYNGTTDELNGILTTQYNELQMKIEEFQQKRCLIFKGGNGWLKTENMIYGKAFKSFTCMFYYTDLNKGINTNNVVKCPNARNNREVCTLFSISSGEDNKSPSYNYDHNIAIEGGIKEEGVVYIRCKPSSDDSQHNFLSVSSPKYSIKKNTWTHIAGVFSNDYKTVSLYINGKLIESKSSILVETEYYSARTFKYGSMGHSPGPFSDDVSAHPFSGGIAWQHWFDYPLCPEGVMQDYKMEFAITSMNNELTNGGWFIDNSQTQNEDINTRLRQATNLPFVNDEQILRTRNLQSINAQVTIGGNQPFINNIQGMIGRNQPSINQPSINQPSINQPSVNQPSINQPSVNQPSVNQPSVNIENNQKTLDDIKSVLRQILLSKKNNQIKPERFLEPFIGNNDEVLIQEIETLMNTIDILKGQSELFFNGQISEVQIKSMMNNIKILIEQLQSMLNKGFITGEQINEIFDLNGMTQEQRNVLMLNSKRLIEQIQLMINNGQISGEQLKIIVYKPETYSIIQDGQISSDRILSIINTPSLNQIQELTSSDDSTEISSEISSTIRINSATWIKTSAPPGKWVSIACSNNGTQVIACQNQGSVYISNNSGKNWSIPNGLPQNTNYSNVSCSHTGDIMLALVDGGAVYLYNKQNNSWATTSLPSANWKYSTCSANGQYLTVVSNSQQNIAGSIYYSNNSGINWNKATINNSTENKWYSISSSADGKNLIALCQTKIYIDLCNLEFNWVNQMFTSTNFGQSWTQTDTQNPNRQWQSVCISHNGSKVIGCVIGGGIYISNNLGQSWTKTLAPDRNWSAVCGTDDLSIMLGVEKTKGEININIENPNINLVNQQWRRTDAKYADWRSIVSSQKADYYFAVEFDGNIWHSPSCNVEQLWKKSSSLNGNLKGVACSQNFNRLLTVNNGIIYSSNDSGNTWTNIKQQSTSFNTVKCNSDASSIMLIQNDGVLVTGIRNSTNSYDLMPYTQKAEWSSIVCSSDGNIMIASVFSGNIFRSTNKGASWIQASSPVKPWTCLAISSSGRDCVGVCDNGFGIFISNDYGITWKDSGAKDSMWMSVVMSSNGKRIAAVEFDGGVHISINGGVSWTKTSAPKNYWQNIVGSSDLSRMVITSNNTKGSGSIFMSFDLGQTWTQPNMPNEPWNSIACSNDGYYIVAVTATGNIYTSSLLSCFTNAPPSQTQPLFTPVPLNTSSFCVTPSRTERQINIVEASFGKNCDDSQKCNVTKKIQDYVDFFTDKKTLSYNFDPTRVGGASTGSCNKQLYLKYHCGDCDIKYFPSGSTATSASGIDYDVFISCEDRLKSNVNVEFYSQPNMGGSKMLLQVGDWSNEKLKANGYDDGDLKSLRIPRGLQIILTDVRGTSVTINANDNSHKDVNDMSSILSYSLASCVIRVKPAPTQITNLQSSEIKDNGFTITWSGAEGVGTYTYLVNNSTEITPRVDEGINNKKIIFSGLPEETTYNIKIVGRNDMGEVSSNINVTTNKPCWIKLGTYKFGVNTSNTFIADALNRPEYPGDGWMLFSPNNQSWSFFNNGPLNNEAWRAIIFTSKDIYGTNVVTKMEEISSNKRLKQLNNTNDIYYIPSTGGVWFNYKLQHTTDESSVVFKRYGSMRGNMQFGNSNKLSFILNRINDRDSIIETRGIPMMNGTYDLYYQFTDKSC